MSSKQPGAMVSVVGRVTGANSIETSDGVAVTLNGDPTVGEFPASGCVEIVGTVDGDAALSPKRAVSFGDDFDLQNYDALVNLIGGKYAPLFQ